VKGIQEKFGSDKFEVLMLSVDAAVHMPGKDPKTGDKQILETQGVQWDNVLMPQGFDDCHRKFNVDGYGMTLVGPDGIVRGVQIYPDLVKQLTAQLVWK